MSKIGTISTLQRLHAGVQTGNTSRIQQHQLRVELLTRLLLVADAVPQVRDFQRVLLPLVLQLRVVRREVVQVVKDHLAVDGVAAVDGAVADEQLQHQLPRLLVEHATAVEDELLVVAAEALEVVEQLHQPLLPVRGRERGVAEGLEDLRDGLGMRRSARRDEVVLVVHRIERDQLRLHPRLRQQRLRVVEGAVVLVAQEGNDGRTVGPDVRAQQHAVDQLHVLPQLALVLVVHRQVDH